MRFYNSLVAFVISGFAGMSIALPSQSAPSYWHQDVSVAIVESTIARHTPETLGEWQYFTGLYLLGQYQVYKRTGESRYLSYIQDWADLHVDENGNLNSTLETLDSMQAGNVLLVLHKETSQQKYKTAADQIRDRIKTYPRTEDGAFWHMVELGPQLWTDGVFMVNPFLARYGAAYGESAYTNDETTTQLLLYAKHLQVGNGLFQHAWDETREAEWADPETGRSPEQWCRAMAWWGLAAKDILDIIPKTHKNRPHLLEHLQKFLEGISRYQDPETGRWFEVINKGDEEDNWTETSSSAMFTDTISRALERGYVHDHHGKFKKVVKKGYKGVSERIVKNSEGYTDVLEIVIGTGVGDYQWYIDRPRQTNDLHGLGAVLLMLEQVLHGGGNPI